MIPDPISGRRIVLGVTGSIAAYKAADVASRLVQAGAEVDVIMTRAATEIIRPLAFQAITHRAVSVDLWSPNDPLGMDHIRSAREADVMLVAPATADTLARLALGRADDALAATALAHEAPLVVAPAMEPAMWAHPATRRNVETLASYGTLILGPAEGRLASGKKGTGRMVEPDTIVDALRWRLSRGGMLGGRTFVISAGPTREAIDPLRFLSNRSTGRMGIALARAARDAGADVILILGPVERPALRGVEVVDVESAESMAQAVVNAADAADAIIMSAAVADFRPAEVSPDKIKKAGRERLSLDLERTRDVLAALAHSAAVRTAGSKTGRRPFVAGFAAETSDPEAEARRKLQEKRLDLIVANRVPGAFGEGDTDVLVIGADGSSHRFSGSKDEVARWIVSVIAPALAPSE